MASFFLLSSLLGLAVAQTTVLTVPNYGGVAEFEGVYLGSVVSANSEATTIKMLCPETSLDCGLFPYQTIVYGASTYHVDMSMDGLAFTGTLDCSTVGKTAAVCTQSMGGSEANFPGQFTETISGTDIPSSILLTVTAGAEKLSSTTDAKTTDAKTTDAGISKTTSSPVTQITGTKGESESSVAPSTGSGSGAAPQATGAAVANNVSKGGKIVGVVAVVVAGLLQ